MFFLVRKRCRGHIYLTNNGFKTLLQPLLPFRSEASTYRWKCQLPSAIAPPWSWRTTRRTSPPSSPWSRRTAPKIKVSLCSQVVKVVKTRVLFQIVAYSGCLHDLDSPLGLVWFNDGESWRSVRKDRPPTDSKYPPSWWHFYTPASY